MDTGSAGKGNGHKFTHLRRMGAGTVLSNIIAVNDQATDIHTL